MLCAGFPCQAFSLAGKRLGFEETRGTLFFDVAEILRRKRPKAFFLENVKGLLIHDKGKTIQTILKVLREDLDYYVPDPQIVNAMNFGVPQHRESTDAFAYTSHPRTLIGFKPDGSTVFMVIEGRGKPADYQVGVSLYDAINAKYFTTFLIWAV